MGPNDDTYGEGVDRRAKWFDEQVAEKVGEPGIGIAEGGADTIMLEPEVRVNFVNGQFLSTIIVAATVIEEYLYNQITFIDGEEKGENHTLKNVLRLAIEDYGIISRDVSGDLSNWKGIYILRNAVAHYREGNEKDALQRKQLERRKEGKETHPNKYGEIEARKMIKSMLLVKSECMDNTHRQWNDAGPLTQGIERIQTKTETRCNNCDFDLTGVELEYQANWDGEEANPSATCPECGSEVLELIRNND